MVAEIDDFLLQFGIRRPAWWADAACAEHLELDWLADGRGSIDRQQQVCAGCLVVAECLQDALEHADLGVRGGLTVRQRLQLGRAEGSTVGPEARRRIAVAMHEAGRSISDIADELGSSYNAVRMLLSRHAARETDTAA